MEGKARNARECDQDAILGSVLNLVCGVVGWKRLRTRVGVLVEVEGGGKRRAG